MAVTPRSLSSGGHPDLDRIRAAGYDLVFPSPGAMPTSEQLREVIPTCVGYLAGIEPITAELLEASPRLRVISRNGVGTDTIDLAAAERCGVKVVNAPAANAQGVAELAIALMLASMRAIAWSDSGLKVGDWRRRQGMEIHGRTLGVVGCGNIGRRVALMAIGLGMEVLGVDDIVHPELAASPQFAYAPLGEVLARSDVVSLHCPPADEPIIGAREIGCMRRHAHLINTARAGLVDDAAVLDALQDDRLGGFATDVFAEEPPPVSPLIEHPRVTVSPHVGGYTAESVDRATRESVVKLLDALEEE